MDPDFPEGEGLASGRLLRETQAHQHERNLLAKLRPSPAGLKAGCVLVGLHSLSEMEVVKAALQSQGPALDNVAVATVDKGYSYAEVLRSAFALSAQLEKELAAPGKVHSLFSKFKGSRSTISSRQSIALIKFQFQPLKCTAFIWRMSVRMPGVQGVNRNTLDGPCIGIMAKPCAEFVASMWAAWLNGAVAVPIALSYPEAEIHHVMTDAVRPLLPSVIFDCTA